MREEYCYHCYRPEGHYVGCFYLTRQYKMRRAIRRYWNALLGKL